MKSKLHLSSLANSLAVCALFSLLAAFQSRALIGTDYQMQLGNPSNASADPGNHDHYLIQRTVEAIDYSDNLGEPNWVSWDLTASDIGNAGRSDSFYTDTTLPTSFYWVTDGDYSGSGYTRGHMCPSMDRTDTAENNRLVFYMSNIIPQTGDNNGGVWGGLEVYCQSLANAGNELLIVCGPSIFDGSRIQPSGKVSIPGYTWKIVVVVPPGADTALNRITASTRVIAVKIPNISGIAGTPWNSYVTSVNQIQADTGLTFFTALDPGIAAVLRNMIDGAPAPAITNFSPTTGAAGTNVVITGANFTSVLAVAFNGVAASFNVNSSTQITATVPSGAESGPISLTTSGGIGASANSFIVTTSALAAIASQPTNQVVNAGATATFSVQAAGNEPLIYQWRKGQTDLSDQGNTSGALTSSLTISNVGPADVGSYAVVVTNDHNSVTSAVVTLTLAQAPQITSQPQNATCLAGTTVFFNVAAAGTGPLHYQWRKNSVDLADGGNISGAATARLTVASATHSDEGTYSVVVTNMAGSATSVSAHLTLGATAPNQTVIAQWNFNNTSLTSPSPSTGSGSAALIGGTTATWAGGSSTDTNAVNNGWNTTTYAAQGTGNKTVGVQFNVSTLGYANIVVRWDQRLSNSGGKYYRLQYSTDGNTFVDYNVVTMNSAGSFAAKTNTLAGVAGVDNSPNFAIRIVGEFESTAVFTTNANYVTASTSNYGAGGTVRFDMLTISGNPLNVTPTVQAGPHSASEMQVTVQGVFGYRYALEASANLADWVSLTTNSAPFLFSDTNAVNDDARFYRARYVPGN